MKLSVAMIAKSELKNLKRLYPLIRDQIDEWVVVVPPGDEAISFLKGKAKVIEKDFTIPIEPEIIEQFREYGLDVDADYRLFQFAAARNESFANASGDYILWLDADDAPVGLKQLRKFIEENGADQYDVLYDYSKDQQGNAISDHWRERIIRNTDKFTWKGAKLGLIHETVCPVDGFSPINKTVPTDIFVVEHHSDHADESSVRNHIALLYEYLKTKGEDARTTYYLGVEFFNRGDYANCVKLMQEYVKVGGWDEERYRAWIRMAEAYHQLGDKESSRNAYLSAIKELPEYPDAYLGIGESYHSSEEWGKAIEFILTGMQKPVPKTRSSVDRVKYLFRPMPFLALAHMQIGKQAEACKWFQKAKQLNPEHPWVVKHESLFDEVKDLEDYVRAFIQLGQISNKRYKKSLPKLAEAIPDELMDQEVLLNFKRKFSTPKIWPENSIVFWCSFAFEEWGPDSLERGCGGSEEAVIHLSKRFVKMGYDVTVFNNCPKEQTVDGVKWVRAERFNPRDIFNILIAWRNNPYLEPRVATKKFIDVHDVPSLKYFPEWSLKDVTMLVKSDYHRSLFPDLKDDNFAVINNGVDFDQFPKTKKIKNNLVWTSSYDRGLEYLLEMWPDIRSKHPEATLDIAYGWNLYDTSLRGRSDDGKEWKRSMEVLMRQDGITVHGRLPSDEVAKLYNQADIWAYPTDFPEIDCITATKAMAAGCVPITTSHAVMKERNQGIMIEGSGADYDVRETFKKELIKLMGDEKKKADIRSKMDVSKFSWDAVAEAWRKLF